MPDLSSAVHALVLCALLAGAPTASASVNPGDVAITTEVAGAVVVKSHGSGPVEAWQKLRDGDRVTVDAGATLVFRTFDDGAVHEVQGPAVLKVDGGVVTAARGAITSTSGDPEVAATLANIPVLVARAASSGAETMRGDQDRILTLSDDERAALDKARATYARMREEEADPSALPELYLASMLLQYDLFDEGIAVLEGAIERCDCSAARDMLTYARTQRPTT
jgi:hypothetical protein